MVSNIFNIPGFLQLKGSHIFIHNYHYYISKKAFFRPMDHYNYIICFKNNYICGYFRYTTKVLPTKPF